LLRLFVKPGRPGATARNAWRASRDRYESGGSLKMSPSGTTASRSTTP
jgi:hypothetical protein